MREIKFRAWDFEINQYRNGDILLSSNGEPIVLYPIKGGNFLFEKLQNLIIEFYTGLKDKNGKEIYEGDICNVDTKFVGLKHLVVWNETKCCFMWRLLDDVENAASKKLKGEDRYIDQYGWGNPCEIIGNIHEHPHLLTDNK